MTRITALLMALALSSCGQAPNPEPEPQIHITGEIKPEGLFDNKKHIKIQINGYPVFDGFLDSYNNAELVGEFNKSITKAKCSGAEPINCLISYKGKETLIAFNIKGQ